MNKKILLCSIIIVAILIGVSFTSIVGARVSQIENLVTIRTTISQVNGINDNEIQVTEEEADEIIALLEHLNQALIENDVESTKLYEEILKEKRILGKHYSVHVQYKIFEKINRLFKKARLPNLGTNVLGFYTKGLVHYAGHIQYRMDLSGSIAYLTFLLAIFFVLFTPFPLNLVYLPLALCIIPYVAIQLIQDFRIFRFVIPSVAMRTIDGNITVINSDGKKTSEGEFDLLLMGFFGIQIQIWKDAEIRYLFLSGYAQFISVTDD